MLARLFLELGHPVEPAQPGDAVEHPGELGVAGTWLWIEDDVALGIDAGRRASPRRSRRVFARSSAGSCQTVIACRSTTQKRHSNSSCSAHPVADGAQVVAEVQVAGRLDAGENAVHGRAVIARQPVRWSSGAGSGAARGPGASAPRRSASRGHAAVSCAEQRVGEEATATSAAERQRRRSTNGPASQRRRATAPIARALPPCAAVASSVPRHPRASGAGRSAGGRGAGARGPAGRAFSQEASDVASAMPTWRERHIRSDARTTLRTATRHGDLHRRPGVLAGDRSRASAP